MAFPFRLCVKNRYVILNASLQVFLIDWNYRRLVRDVALFFIPHHIEQLKRRKVRRR